jgi:hypothetical protein
MSTSVRSAHECRQSRGQSQTSLNVSRIVITASFLWRGYTTRLQPYSGAKAGASHERIHDRITGRTGHWPTLIIGG